MTWKQHPATRLLLSGLLCGLAVVGVGWSFAELALSEAGELAVASLALPAFVVFGMTLGQAVQVSNVAPMQQLVRPSPRPLMAA